MLKHFFAFTSAFALALASFAIADTTPSGSLYLFSDSAGKVLATQPDPQPGSPLILADPSSPSNTFIVSYGGLGPIRLLGTSEELELCVSASGQAATVDTCADDPKQRWLVNATDPTTISNQDGGCLAVPSPAPLGASVSVVGCKVDGDPKQPSPPPEQLWIQFPVQVSLSAA